MKIRSRLRHAAAGLLGTFSSRYNDVGGQWALGQLYRDAGESLQPFVLDLLSGTAQPPGDTADVVLQRYAYYLRTALNKQKIDWKELAQAMITVRFNAQVPDPNFHYPCPGDPFICTVALQTAAGHVATFSAVGRCYRDSPV